MDTQYNPQAWVERFMIANGQWCPPTPRMPTEEVRDLRIALLEEEVQEFKEACHEGSLVAMADALGDIGYVNYGAAVACGIWLPPVFREIHLSNMKKVGAPKNSLGKVSKPSEYVPPDVEGILMSQGWWPPA